MRSAFLLPILLGARAVVADAPPREIRFCPADVAHTYPLDSRGRVQSLLVPHIAVINHAAAPFEVHAIGLELLAGERVLDERHFDAADVARFASNSPGIQEVLQMASFQYCGTHLVASGIKLAGPVLAANEGMIVTSQVLAFNDRRDTLRVRVEGTSGGEPTELSATLPVTSEFSKTSWLFPLHGVSYVGWGASLHTAHRWVLPEAYALDIARIGDGGLTHSGDGLKFTDYYGYGTEVYAAAAGRVMESANDVPEDATLIQRLDESVDSYTARVRENTAKMLEIENGLTGNYVFLDHGNGEYSLYAHLQPGSVRVRTGDTVTAGQLLGKLGSSGNSTEPHLHFHVCSGSSALDCNGMPITFSNIRILWAENERALQSGDTVIAN